MCISFFLKTNELESNYYMRVVLDLLGFFSFKTHANYFSIIILSFPPSSSSPGPLQYGSYVFFALEPNTKYEVTDA